MAKNYLDDERSDCDLRKLPEDLVQKVREYSTKPEYQHPTGCDCAKSNFQKNRCPGEGAALIKIGKALGISAGTVHCILDSEYRRHVNEDISKKYLHSEYGKSAIKLRIKSKGWQDAMGRYRRTEKWKASCRGRGMKYRQTEKGKEPSARSNFIKTGSLTYGQLNLNQLEIRKWAYINYFNKVFNAGIEELIE